MFENTLVGTQLEDEPDEDLLVYISLPGEDGRHAWAEFYCRHAPYVLSVLRTSWRTVLDDGEIEDAVQETLVRVNQYAESYNPPDGVEEEDGLDAGRRRVRAWLGRIATNVVKDMLAGPDRGNLSTDDLNTEPPTPEEHSADSPSISAMSRALSELSEREQDVLRTTMLFWKPGEVHQRLPNAASRALAQRWDTTPTTIRAIRSRAMKRLKVRVEQILEEGQA